MIDWLQFAAGAAIVLVVLDAAIRTFVVPRAIPVTFTYLVFRTVRAFLGIFARMTSTYEGRDKVMAFYAPFALLAFPAVSLILVITGFTLMFEADEHQGWRDAYVTSGSSMLTLGFERPPDLPATTLAFVEAAIGLSLAALLIAYLPTIYGAFSRREAAVTDLAVRAGTPATSWQMLERAHAAGYMDQLDPIWETWSLWFGELSETHTSFGGLPHFRSPNPHRSWITASGAVLDACSLRYAVLDIPFTPAAGLCIRSGYLALREIAAFAGYEFDGDPQPDDPISIARDEFDEVYEHLAAAGLPMRTDREEAWRDFAGWRVNYDSVLVSLAGYVMAPYGPWTSDRSLRRPLPRRSPVRRAADRVRRADAS